ncbi:MAG: 5-(carboxyamino)imidazole ribonucleotide synthase, partial [Cyanobacteria bacterium J06628_3]
MKHIGVIGGGQLALMMGTAAQKLGVKLIIQTPNLNDPAVGIANDTIFAAVDDARATAELAKKCDVITFENEFINIEALSQLATQKVCFRPRIESLSPLLDKYHQRCFLQDLGIPMPKFQLPESLFTVTRVLPEKYTKNNLSQEWELQF